MNIPNRTDVTRLSAALLRISQVSNVPTGATRSFSSARSTADMTLRPTCDRENPLGVLTLPSNSWYEGVSGSATNDSLTYSLDGKDSKAKSVAGGTVTLLEYLRDNPSTSETETDSVVALALRGRNLDFESRHGPFELGIFVTDGWSNPVRIPIQISLIDVNEIEVEKQIEDQRLINGLSTKFDLRQYFSDPEGDEITFEAYTDIYTDVVEVNNDTDSLTIHGKHATAGEGGERTVTVTVFATDSKGKVSDPIDFDLTTRYSNDNRDGRRRNHR